MVSFKVNYTLATRSSNQAPSYLIKEVGNILTKNLHLDIFRSFIHACQNLEATRYSSVALWVNKLWFTQGSEDTSVGKNASHGSYKLRIWVQVPRKHIKAGCSDILLYLCFGETDTGGSLVLVGQLAYLYQWAKWGFSERICFKTSRVIEEDTQHGLLPLHTCAHTCSGTHRYLYKHIYVLLHYTQWKKPPIHESHVRSLIILPNERDQSENAT